MGAGGVTVDGIEVLVDDGDFVVGEFEHFQWGIQDLCGRHFQLEKAVKFSDEAI